MKRLSESLVIEKKSKFYGYMYSIDSEDDVKGVIELLKKEHKKYKHIVYAYKLNNIERKTDDKEPSNTAGKPILDIINYNNLDNVLIVVVRIFGGTLLGVGLLTRSYSKCASLLISEYKKNSCI